MSDTTIDHDTIKQRQQAGWSAGDYARIGTTLQIVGERLVETTDVHAGASVIDLAAGNGNAALAAARRDCDVLAVDYVPELLEHLRRRAEADQLRVETHVGDIEALDLDDDRFDVALSSFGVAFAPKHRQVASEIVRVCRPDARIGLANWTPDSFIAGLLGTIGRYVPPPAGVPSPLEWGTESHLRELFDEHATSLDVDHRHFVFRYRSPKDFVEVFRTYYGPMVKAFGALDDEHQQALHAELVALCEQHDTPNGQGLRIPSQYLEAVVTVR